MAEPTDSFTVKEILVEIRSDVKGLAQTVARIDREGSIGTKSELSDHEIRLRSLEKFRNAIPSIAVLGFILAAVAGAVEIIQVLP